MSSGGGKMKYVSLLCQHMPTLYNSTRSVALRHTDNNLRLFNRAVVKMPPAALNLVALKHSAALRAFCESNFP